MKKIILSLVVVALVVGGGAWPVFAQDLRSVVGGKVDAPNLIRFTKNLTLGVEGGKDIYTNAFQDSASWIEDDKGFFGFLKITWTGSLFDFTKNKKDKK